MKTCAFLLFMIFVAKLQAQTETAEKIQVAVDTQIIRNAVIQSKKDLDLQLGLEKSNQLVVVGIDYESPNLKNTATPVISENEKVKKSNRMIYVIWGYHRGFHTKSDTTFHTPDGNFTIHDAQATDRPTGSLRSYYDPIKMTEPQYIFRIGYALNSKWALEIGTDHMKWVFNPNKNYKITGDYNRPVWINDKQVSFDQAMQEGNAGFVLLEHTDGYNYANASAVYTIPIFESKNKRFRFDAGIGAGAGVLVTKTRTRLRDTADGQWRDVDNKFHLSGFGLHTDTRLKVTYRLKSGKEFFLLGSGRGVMGKVNDAPLFGDVGSISHTPIYSFQVFFGGGVSIPVFNK